MFMLMLMSMAMPMFMMIILRMSPQATVVKAVTVTVPMIIWGMHMDGRRRVRDWDSILIRVVDLNR